MKKSGHKYRLAMLDDLTLREVFHFRVSMLGAVTVITISIILLLVLLSLLIVYTPLRNVLPGYSESLRQQLIQESARVDSLQSVLVVQRDYLDVIKQVTAGDINTDSIESLDSLQRVEHERILTIRNEATETFKAQYEEKERDRLLLFDTQTPRAVHRLNRPVRGVVIESAHPDKHQYGVSVRTAKNENVTATTRGTLVSVERMADNTFTLLLQHGSFVTIYRRVSRALKPRGARVEGGESLGLTDGEHDIVIELWDGGQFVNPEEVIVW